ncbi:MAG: YCF48-related protein [Candidatus Kapaibacterium sp.]
MNIPASFNSVWKSMFSIIVGFIMLAGGLFAQSGTYKSSRDSGLAVIHSRINYRGIAASDSLHYMVIGNVGDGDDFGARKTTDGGLSWNTVTYDSATRNRRVPYTSVAYPTGNLCLIGTRNLFIKRTTNGGETWNNIPCDVMFNGDTMQISQISMCDSLHGVACAYRVLLKTGDGGASWQHIDFPHQLDTSRFGFRQLICLDPTTYVGAREINGQPYGIFRTEDGGAQWTSTVVPAAHVICFTDALNGWLAGSDYNSTGGVMADYILRTRDGGRSWSQVYKDTNNSRGVTAISFADRENGMVTLYNFAVLQTTDGGNSWTSHDMPKYQNSQPVMTSLAFPTPHRALLLTIDYLILYTDIPPASVIVPFAPAVDIAVYPNPLPAAATITYGLRRSSNVRLSMVDVLGREVLLLVNAWEDEGDHHVGVYTGNLPRGRYFLNLETEAGTMVRPVVILK